MVLKLLIAGVVLLFGAAYPYVWWILIKVGQAGDPPMPIQPYEIEAGYVWVVLLGLSFCALVPVPIWGKGAVRMLGLSFLACVLVMALFGLIANL